MGFGKLARRYRSAAFSGAGTAMLLLSLVLGTGAWAARGDLLHALVATLCLYAFLISTLAVCKS